MPRPRKPYDPELEAARERQRAKTQRYRERNKPAFRAIIALFLDRPCADCGQQFPPPVMQPDHVEPKRFPISWFRGGNGSERLLRAELAKCEVRCANCHVLRHAS